MAERDSVTPGSGIHVGELGTASTDCTVPRDEMIRPAYTGPPPTGVTIMAKLVTLLPLGGATGTTTDDPAPICTILAGAAAPAEFVAVVIRTVAAFIGADSTSAVLPADFA